MSAIDTTGYPVSPEKESGDGEMNCYKPAPCEGSTSAHAVISDIMNDILDNTWEIIMSRSIQQKSKVEKISPNVVGDILENILSSSQNSDMSNENYRQDETVLLDDEIKRIIKEMKYPPEQKNIICTQGVGDQLRSKSEVTPDKIITESPKRNTLERKNRLTNLVRNSKQMLTKLVIANDNDNELKHVRSEELHEKLLKVIDLDTGHATNYAETSNSSAEPGILQLPSESTMDMVDLEPNIHKESEGEAQKDKKEEDEEEASGPVSKIEGKKGAITNKKKWNLGAKIMKYFKRHPKKDQNS